MERVLITRALPEGGCTSAVIGAQQDDHDESWEGGEPDENRWAAARIPQRFPSGFLRP